MIHVDIEFFKHLYSDDIIYHYTKASTAIDFILFNNQLRFNKAMMSIDPIESKKARRGTVYYSNIDGRESESHYADINEIHNYVDDMEDQFNLICFCQNHMGEDFASKNYISPFKGHEELFGFTKLRMWDQYADKFSGVCIAFSKEKILSLNQNLELINGDVQYLTFDKLYIEKVSNIQGDHLKAVGKEHYMKQLKTTIKQSFFFKNIDYSGEHEYRIGTLFDKTKCSMEIVQNEPIFDKNMMLDISGCIEAIFVSSYANEKQKSILMEYAEQLNVKLVEMQWEYNTFEVNDYIDWIKFLKSIKINSKQ